MTDEDRIRGELDALAALEQRIIPSNQGAFVSPGSTALLGEWKTRALSLVRPLDRHGAFGPAIEAVRPQDTPGAPRIFWTTYAAAKGALQGFKAQFEASLLSDIRLRVTADVLSELLDQAQYLLDQCYHLPAASLAGAVLEDALRRLMVKHGLPPLAGHSNLGQLNDVLARAGVYNAADKSNVDRWRKLRNDADHGLFTSVVALDVKQMIESVRDFLARHL